MSIHPFLEDQEHLPPGRFRLSWDEARELLVDNPLFAGSQSRSELWRGLTRYIARFFELQDRYEDLLDGRQLALFVWIGGSFASKKVDPRQLDLSIAIDVLARRALAKQPGVGWLNEATNRSHCVKNYGVSPIEIPFVVVPSPFRSDQLGLDEQSYLRERGAWDDWWQRIRTPGVVNCPPSEETAGTARGYLEVTL
ncbi:DUF6932 family protein [Lentzea sp. E54]|uniref:DUF6932 family protein n=1 Tax=Lentzea xerophila TaxID=3435883 RepID=UPI003DA69B5B